MPIICPAILAANEDEYHKEVEKVARFAHRIQIDLTDGQFASRPTIKPGQAWWPVGVKADFHLMYREPLPAIRIILEHQPHMIIVHYEAEGDFPDLADYCHQRKIRVGVALLQKTPAGVINPAIDLIDHVLIFSGELGKYGGTADLGLLDKVKELKDLKPGLEVGWDGGITDQNVAELVTGGVDVLNVGGFLQKSDDPHKTFTTLQRIADETGTT